MEVISKNTLNTKILIFRKVGRLRGYLQFKYGENNIEIVNRFVYLGIVFSTSGCFADAQNTLAVQRLKAILKMNKYLYEQNRTEHIFYFELSIYSSSSYTTNIYMHRLIKYGELVIDKYDIFYIWLTIDVLLY
jgi:hypothetical protein